MATGGPKATVQAMNLRMPAVRGLAAMLWLLSAVGALGMALVLAAPSDEAGKDVDDLTLIMNIFLVALPSAVFATYLARKRGAIPQANRQSMKAGEARSPVAPVSASAWFAGRDVSQVVTWLHLTDASSGAPIGWVSAARLLPGFDPRAIGVAVGPLVAGGAIALESTDRTRRLLTASPLMATPPELAPWSGLLVGLLGWSAPTGPDVPTLPPSGYVSVSELGGSEGPKPDPEMAEAAGVASRALRPVRWTLRVAVAVGILSAWFVPWMLSSAFVFASFLLANLVVQRRGSTPVVKVLQAKHPEIGADAVLVARLFSAFMGGRVYGPAPTFRAGS